MDQILFWLVPAASIMALCFAWYFHRQMMKESEGTPQMIKIAAAVRKGAMSYLRQQYKIVGWVFRGWLSFSPLWHTVSECRTPGCRLLSLPEDSFPDFPAFWV